MVFELIAVKKIGTGESPCRPDAASIKKKAL